jgi:hypothetical protein
MSTGVAVSDSAISKYAAFKKSSSPLRYMILHIQDGKIEVELESEDKSYDEFLSHLSPDSCRFAFYKTAYKSKDNRDVEKVAFISW